MSSPEKANIQFDGSGGGYGSVSGVPPSEQQQAQQQRFSWGQEEASGTEMPAEWEDDSMEKQYLLGGEKEKKVFVNAGRQQTTTAMQTFINLFKSYLGSGLLGLPFAFKEGGVLATFFMMALVGIISAHTMYWLVACKRKINTYDTSVVTYSDIGRHTYGKWMARAIDFLLLFTQFGFTCVYVVYLSTNTQTFMPHINWRLVMLMWLPALCILANLQTLKHMSPIALLANITILFSLCVVLIAAITNLAHKLDHNHTMDAVDVHWFINPSLRHVPVAFGMAVYAFEGIGVVLPAETSMKQPRKFPMVLTWVVVVSTINYIMFGLLCYLGFGHSTDDLITKNLKEFANGNDVWVAFSYIVRILLLFTIFATYPIQLFVVTDIGEEAMFKPGRLSPRFKLLKQIIFRCCLVLLGCVVAVAVPNFGLLIGLIGALGSASLQFIFPSLFIFKLFPESSIWKKLLSGLYIAFGVAGGLLGTALTIEQIVETY
ncbi:Proton-coupled amino acid transporter 1 [Balamuthia mandrillaris]